MSTLRAYFPSTSKANCALYLGAALLVGVPARVLLPQARQSAREERRAVLLGKVLDDASDLPLDGVSVEIAGTRASVVTDTRGDFVVGVGREELLTLTLRRIGYRELTQIVHVPAGDTTRISFFLTPAATTLDTVSVVAEAVSRSPRLAGFERRRQQHIGGAFITRAEIERRNAIATSQLLLNMIGVRVIDSAGVKLLASARGYKVVFGRTPEIAPCIMAVGVDGQIKEWGYPVDDITPNDIYGVEVYSGPATMPREFATLRPDGYCGLVMIWTRADR